MSLIRERVFKGMTENDCAAIDVWMEEDFDPNELFEKVKNRCNERLKKDAFGKFLLVTIMVNNKLAQQYYEGQYW